MAIKLNTVYPEAYNERGKIKFHLNDKKGACADWNRASELGVKEAGEFLKLYCK